jgi:protein-disulfide isomerase
LAALGVALYLLSHYVIESVCLVCAGTYLVNIGLPFVTFMALRRVGTGVLHALRDDVRAIAGAPGPFALFEGALVVVMVIFWLTVPPYWRIEFSTGPGGVNAGVTADGHPWIGAAEPVLEIEEYSDYQCPHCRRGHDDVRNLIEQRPDRVRLIHRHFPLDHNCNAAVREAFHPQACRYALMSFCAQEQGRFWEANDYLFAQGRQRTPVSVEDLAAGAGLDAGDLRDCVSGEKASRAIQRDLESGRALRVRGTPTFVVGGEIYPGRIPPEVIIAALAEEPGAGSREASGE